MTTSYTSAFWLAVLSCVIAGAAVGGIRTGRNSNGDGTFTLAWVVFGGFGAAIIFGALVAFQAVSYFLTGPESPDQSLA